MSPLKFDNRFGCEITRLAEMEHDAKDYSEDITEMTIEDEEIRREAGLT
jgi:hypothetical protein